MSTTTTRPAVEPAASGHIDTGRPGAPVPRSLTVPGVLVPSLAVWFGVLASSLCLGTVFQDSGWFGASLLTATVVVGVGAFATWLRVPMVLVPVLCAFGMFAALTLRFVDDAPWGFLPSPDALAQLRDVLARGTTDVDRFAPPVPFSEGLAAVTALGVGSVALVVFVLQVVLRLPAIAGLPLVALYVVPAAILTGGAPWWAFVAVVAGWLVLLVADERLTLISWGRLLKRNDKVGGTSALSGLSSSAFRLGAVAVVLALVLPIVIPGLADAVIGRTVTGGGGADGEGTGEEPASIGLDPIVGLQRNLLNNPDVTVLTYSSTDPTPGYLRAVVLEEFDGDSWKPRGFSPDSGSSPLADGVSSLSGLPADVKRQQYAYRVTAGKLDSRYLPLPETSLTVGLDGEWFVDQATSTVFGVDDGTTTAGKTWNVDAAEIDPTPAQLRDAPPLQGLDRSTVASSIAIPASLAETARQVTLGTTTDFDAARALEEWFHANFTYSVDVQSDSSASYLEQFLVEKTGYCEQFSATMALMATSLGIRSRVAVGYTSGSPLTGQDGQWRVSGKNAHAWPELYFSGIGWVRFEPTPPTGGAGIVAPPYTDRINDTPTQEPTQSASARPGANPDDRYPNRREAEGSVDLPADSTGFLRSADWWRVWSFVGVLALLLGAALVPAGRRFARRRRRLGAEGDVEDAWAELRDSALDVGAPWSDSRTPRQAVAGLVVDQHLSGAAADAAIRLGRAVERARYAPTPADTTLVTDDVATVRAALLQRLDRSRRARITLAPASLRANRRPATA
jgi:transglutaminase-like putative cysteine protease